MPQKTTDAMIAGIRELGFRDYPGLIAGLFPECAEGFPAEGVQKMLTRVECMRCCRIMTWDENRRHLLDQRDRKARKKREDREARFALELLWQMIWRTDPEKELWYEVMTKQADEVQQNIDRLKGLDPTHWKNLPDRQLGEQMVTRFYLHTQRLRTAPQAAR